MCINCVGALTSNKVLFRSNKFQISNLVRDNLFGDGFLASGKIQCMMDCMSRGTYIQKILFSVGDQRCRCLGDCIEPIVNGSGVQEILEMYPQMIRKNEILMNNFPYYINHIYGFHLRCHYKDIHLTLISIQMPVEI